MFQDKKKEVASYELHLNSAAKGIKQGKLDIIYEFKVMLSGDSFEGTKPLITGKIKQENDTSVKGQYSNQKLILELSMKDEYFGATLKLNLDSKTKLKEKVVLSKITDKNGKNILNLKEEDMAKLMLEMQNTTMGLYEEAEIGN